jgi:putative ABC transport system permease protein
MSPLARLAAAIGHTVGFAARNLLRNGRRTAVTVVSIAFGFTALGLFAGYTMNVYQGLRNQAVYGELLGHLTISKRGLQAEGRLHPEKYLFSADDLARISATVRQVAPQARFAPRLAVSGLISNGRVSTIFIAEGVAPADMHALRGPLANASGALDPAQPSGITVARGLAAMLGFKDGDDASLLSSTLRGQANAVDAQIVDSFATGNAGTNDKFMFMPLEQARALYDAAGRADRLTVVLPDVEQTDAERARIALALQPLGLDLEVKTWHELSSFYSQVKGLFDMIFAFLFTIVLVISVMALANVIGMNVVERTREIGALRALGMRRAGVTRLFLVEAMLLALIGCAGGLLLTLALRYGINVADITYIPPNATDKVPLTVGLNLPVIGAVAVLLAVLGAVAAWLPARRAARQPIIDALGHV